MLCGMMLITPQTARANDYLEHSQHYTVQSMGNGVLRFTIPIWVYGAVNDYCLDGTIERNNNYDSYVWYSTEPNTGRGSDKVHRIASVAARHYGKNDTDGGEGEGFIYIHEGSAIIQSTYNGEKIVLTANDGTYWDGWTRPLSLKRKSDDDHKRITYITFDWYPPASLQGQDFYWGMSAWVYKKQNNVPDNSYDFWWNWPEKYKGGEIPQSPELYEPYLYTLDSKGTTGYGCAAIQYAVYQEPISYHTSLDPTEISTSSRSETLIVPTKDSVQRLFSATFNVYINKDADSKQILKTNEVHIPAYHRPYNLAAKELLDDKGSVTGEMNLTWSVRNPGAKDLVEDDVFELQRATQVDFSDAQTIDVQPMMKDTTYYHYKDNPLEALGADTTTQTFSISHVVTTYNQLGEPFARDRVTIVSKKVKAGQNLYYRVRRASSSVWGWNHEFAKATQATRTDFLAPLAEKQADYTKDKDYETNRKVNFQFKLDNSIVVPTLEPESECEWSNVREKMIANAPLPVRVKLSVSHIDNFDASRYEYLFSYKEPESSNRITKTFQLQNNNQYNTELTFPAEATNLLFEVKYQGNVIASNTPAKGLPYVKTVLIKYDYTRVTFDYDAAYYKQVLDSVTHENPLNEDSLKHVLYQELQDKLNHILTDDTNARCNWDQNAVIYLQRTAVETGETVETAVPAANIVRQTDGSWIATVTDVADQPCVHYEYHVRLDDSHSLLKVLDPRALEPKKLNGPDLYFNSAAQISEIHASQGDDRYGVLINWAATGGGADYYKLERRFYGSEADFDSITTQGGTDYRDLTAEPGLDYEYRVTVFYTCQQTTTSHSATVVGRRSAYGQIRGRIHYEDGTGCAGVTVAIEDQNTQEKFTTTTNEAGEYSFENLLYYYTPQPHVKVTYVQGEACPSPTSTTRIRVLDASGTVIRDWRVLPKDTVLELTAGSIVEAKCSEMFIVNADEVLRAVITGNGTLSCETQRVLVSDMIRKPKFLLRFTDDGSSQEKVTSTEYVITPTSGSAEFIYNHVPTAHSTSITLDKNMPVVEAIEFDNISSVRCTGRVLYENSTVPVRDASLKLNGKIVKTASGVLHTDVSGHFELRVPKSAPFTLQAVKEGHIFEGGGFIRMDDDSLITTDIALDGVRIWDKTKVRLAGRIVGGMNQASQPLGFGLSQNNLGDNIQLVLELEGDNTSYLVRIPEDPDKDTLQFAIPHIVMSLADSTESSTGETQMLYQRKRIILTPDPVSGEYCADLFPVRYKITQATATGYATLFAKGKTSETIDLSDGAHHADSAEYDNKIARWNERFDIIYRSPINITCKQLRYGMVENYLGEKTITRQNILNQQVEIPLAECDSNGVYHYVFGAPVFATGEYQFQVTAHEDYYYNNEPNGKHEEVRIKGGKLKVYNGMYDDTNTMTFDTPLNMDGQAKITIPVNYVSFLKTGTDALRVLDLSVESDGQYIEKQAVKAYVMGNRAKGNDFLINKEAAVTLLDVLRDPPGAKSYAYLEKGSTYSYSYTYDWTVKFGLELGVAYGAKNVLNIGTYLGAGGGIYSGYTIDNTVSNSFKLPITSSVFSKNNGTYTFTTKDRIETSSGTYHVGSDADVYIGVTQNVYFGLTDAVKPIDSVTYTSMAIQLEDSTGDLGTSRLVARGEDIHGHPYYLVIAEETEAGTYVSGSFAYTQEYILTSVLPRLVRERDALLLTGDSLTVQAIANARNKVVYWSQVSADTHDYAIKNYVKLYPNGESSEWMNVDDVALYNQQIQNWIDLIRQNEQQKIAVIYGVNADLVGNYSVSNSVKQSHSESYDFGATSSFRWDFPSLSPSAGVNLLKPGISSVISKSTVDAVNRLAQMVATNQDGTPGGKNPLSIATSMPGAKWDFSLVPLLDVDFNRDPVNSKSFSKSAGFVLETDEYSYMNVTVSRLREPNNWFNDSSRVTREWVDNGNDYSGSEYLYGSFVYMLNGGASKCPWEDVERSVFYEQGGQPVDLSKGTLKLENPKIDLDVHERSDVPHDKPAVFNIRLTNELEQEVGIRPITFNLKLDEPSNPKGAKVYVDGMPLTGVGHSVMLAPGQIVNKTMEVYAGEDYDYENISIKFSSTCDIYNYTLATFSVHYMPVSCDVNIAAPRDKWVMNTLSPRDSTGYYLPVVIDGFDVNYRGFDHIELQYKLTKESDDAWVNLCSYYASEARYEAASGTKAMISSGRIENVRFYGERDPIEQEYDLRAVSFCRHGSTFITRSSAVITGVKDTRPPVLFGAPQPVNGILNIGDDLKLRFSEAIAGNYLDEDNNFQLIGVTNRTGITATTSLHFTGENTSFARTKVSRNLTDKAFTIDMIVKPTAMGKEETFFVHESQVSNGLIFGLLDNNCLYIQMGNNAPIRSLPIADPIKDFTRVVACIDVPNGKVRFYVGTLDITDPNAAKLPEGFVYSIKAPFVFGQGFDGNMLEARVWGKALTEAEIANTHMHYLSGYERELLAYYRMNEGKGTLVNDQANGANLYLEGTSWTQPKGISMRMTADKPVELDNRYLNRSDIQDGTLMFWCRVENDCKQGNLFSAGRNDSLKQGFALRIEDSQLVMYSDSTLYTTNTPISDGGWHHIVLAINRTYNNVSLFFDGGMTNSFPADDLCALSGRMYLGGYDGHVDEFVLYEQALPHTLIVNYDNISPEGDEMGIIGFLPFETTKENSSGIMELVFTTNDMRMKPDGKLVNPSLSLVINTDVSDRADKNNYAPLSDRGSMTKMNFNWTFDNTELLINLKMEDKEINKQTIYVTVRDVEDQNGNPMTSPVTWTAFMDRNSLKWLEPSVEIYEEYGREGASEDYVSVRFANTSGYRHQYTIESLPEWLSCKTATGVIEPVANKELRLYYDREMPVGNYTDIIYLTDENGLSEPLNVEMIIQSDPPYSEVDKTNKPMNTSVCAQVMLKTNDRQIYDIDENDRVFALFGNECVGIAKVTFDNTANTSYVYLTIYGNDDMVRKPLNFQLWQASTGKIFTLAPDRQILFAHGYVYGCGDENPVVLVTAGSETQSIPLNAGWNWISTNLQVQTPVANLLSATPWTEGDQIKSPAERQFAAYSEAEHQFVGSLEKLDYVQMYMAYSARKNTMRITGDPISQDQAGITIRGDGQWNSFPCLFTQTTSVKDALADYYDHATPGDIIKSHDHFAVFSKDKHWVGDLAVLRPGEGYLLRRMGLGTVSIHLYNKTITSSEKPAKLPEANSEAPQHAVLNTLFSNPNASTNMTMIATIVESQKSKVESQSPILKVYAGDELVGAFRPFVLSPFTFHPSLSSGAASPLSEASPFYFLTIQSDAVGKQLRFETEDGTTLSLVGREGEGVSYLPDTHHGSLEAPVILQTTNANANAFKFLENDHVIIIRNGERYNVTGQRL